MEFLVIARPAKTYYLAELLPPLHPLPMSFVLNNALQYLPNLKRSAAAHLQLLLKLLNDYAYRSNRCRPEKPLLARPPSRHLSQRGKRNFGIAT